MNKLPQGITIEESKDNVKIIAKNFEDTLLLMQIFLMLLPLLGLNGYLIYKLSWWMTITIPPLIALIYWMLYNLKDNYVIRITDETVSVIKGMNKNEIVNQKLENIIDVLIKRKNGKVLTSSRTGLSSSTPNINELIIKTDYSEILVTNSLPYSNQMFIKEQILKKRKTIDNTRL